MIKCVSCNDVMSCQTIWDYFKCFVRILVYNYRGFWGVGIFLYFFSLLWVVFFELVVRQMFPSDILLGFLLRFLYKSYKMFAKNLSCHILLSFNHITLKTCFCKCIWLEPCLQVMLYLIGVLRVGPSGRERT